MKFYTVAQSKKKVVNRRERCFGEKRETKVLLKGYTGVIGKIGGEKNKVEGMSGRELWNMEEEILLWEV